MNIAVMVKVLPDDQDIVVTADRKLDASKAKPVVSTYDLNAIEAAALLAADTGAATTAIVAGPASVDDSKTKKNILSRGIDALGEVTVRVKAGGGEVFTGRGADGDIIVSSAKAYLNALNRLLTTAR